MAENFLKKETELREWQRMFNPTKAQEQSSVILKKREISSEKTQQKNSSNFSFSW